MLNRRDSGTTWVLGSIALGALLSVGIGLSAAEAVVTRPDVMALEDVKPGMKGYGLTVFSGTEPTKFDVEVISTLHNFRPDQHLILIKTPNHPRLEAARTVAGMSGSPIYIDGKMIGAYAYGWLFGVEAVAGVTPIENMLEELDRKLPAHLAPGGSPMAALGGTSPSYLGSALSTSAKRRYRGPIEDYSLDLHARELASYVTPEHPDHPVLAPASTPILFGGVSTSMVAEASELLRPMGLIPVQAGGAGTGVDPDAPKNFVDGGAIGVELVRGDVSAMGLGTVTRVENNRVLAFGHPMLNGGVADLPTAIAKVHWILASHNRSFKIGEPVRPLGSLVNDRQSAIVVHTDRVAPTFPVTIDIQGVPGAPKTKWVSEAAHDEFMAPMLAAMALGSAIETTTAERRDMTWRSKGTIQVKGYGTLDIEDFGSGSGNPVGRDTFSRSRLIRAAGALLNNPWETVEIEGIDVDVDVTFEKEVLSLRGAKLLDAELEPGDPARIALEMVPFKGDPFQRVVEVPIPHELSGQTVTIELRPGYKVQRPQAAPESVAELFAALPNEYFPSEAIIATIELPAQGLAAFRGVVASHLPAGAMDTLASSTDSVTPQTQKAELNTVIDFDGFVVGDDKVMVEVKPNVR